MDLDNIFGGMSINWSIITLRQCLERGLQNGDFSNCIATAQDVLNGVSGKVKYPEDHDICKLVRVDFDLYNNVIQRLGNRRLSKVLSEIMRLCK
jgi:hypothetical protein